jgi:hypothetical protein
VSALGLAAAAAGLLVLGLRGPVAVFATGGTLHVGSSVLTIERSTATTSLYNGDAAYLLSVRGDGAVVGSAAWTDGSHDGSGTCVMREQASHVVESCWFDAAGARTTSVDSYALVTPGEWNRTYADGRQVTIAVPAGGGLVPVPFPIGR